MNCNAIDAATSSPASGAGPSPSSFAAGLRTWLSGLDPVPASPSARLADLLGLLTSGTSGRAGSTSSTSAALRSSLESRLRQRLGTGGSILFTLTWKASATPAGTPICQLRASARRTSDSGCSSWPTALAADSRGSTRLASGRRNLEDAAALAPWPTAAARDWKGATNERWGSNARPLNEVAALAPTTTTQDAASSGAAGYSTASGRHSGMTLTDAARMASGTTANGSPAGTVGRGQLNPALARWLMGYPTAWDCCGATATPSSRRSARRSPAPSST